MSGITDAEAASSNKPESVQKIHKNESVISDITKDMESQCTLKTLSDNDQQSKCTQQEIEENCSIAEATEDWEKNSDVREDCKQEELLRNEFDDYVDEEQLKILEVGLSEDEIQSRYKEAQDLKAIGNDQFKDTKYRETILTYTNALKLCPIKYTKDRSILYANRAASKSKIDRKQSAIDDCSKAIELNDKYTKVYLRRAKLYEETEKLDEALEDYKKILTYDPDNGEALKAVYRLPPLIQERNEKLKTEMLGKLKDLGNVILKPFGLSTDNFQLTQDPTSGGYSVNFTQNK
ncbi:hypothetical protein NQ315_017270 [Exocentrus adspersus]|uniref:Tetratricopeptide repeat protein 1 n=1 Tax=Exocentrus adspersus TaxID=1586481 RepID=A0AAV8VFE7_9CUCU|nr:hypothetical protein NQ315_017270 [Exocentrus adspersus]